MKALIAVLCCLVLVSTAHAAEATGLTAIKGYAGYEFSRTWTDVVDAATAEDGYFPARGWRAGADGTLWKMLVTTPAGTGMPTSLTLLQFDGGIGCSQLGWYATNQHAGYYVRDAKALYGIVRKDILHRYDKSLVKRDDAATCNVDLVDAYGNCLMLLRDGADVKLTYARADFVRWLAADRQEKKRQQERKY